jgi:hypothetical protein
MWNEGCFDLFEVCLRFVTFKESGNIEMGGDVRAFVPQTLLAQTDKIHQLVCVYKKSISIATGRHESLRFHPRTQFGCGIILVDVIQQSFRCLYHDLDGA